MPLRQKYLSSVNLPQPFRSPSPPNSPQLSPLRHLADIPHFLWPSRICTVTIIVLDTVSTCRFQYSSGIPTKAFLDLLALYPSSTLTEHEGKVFRQRKEVCIASWLALPILSKIYLLYIDRAIKECLKGTIQGCSVFRYVDDYLTVRPSSASSDGIAGAFSSCPFGLTFTREHSLHEGSQYLDLRLHLKPMGRCWAIQQRYNKPVLPFSSSHSKTV